MSGYPQKKGINWEAFTVIIAALTFLFGSGIYVWFVPKQGHPDGQEATPASRTAIISPTPNPDSPPSYLSVNGTLTFADPLTQEDTWHPAGSPDRNESWCQFASGAYHVGTLHSGYTSHCNTSEKYSNFAFEVDLTVAQGDCGGIVFRDTAGAIGFYKFTVCQNGRYWITNYIGGNGGTNSMILQDGTSPVMKSGLGRQNKVAVVASRSNLAFYINEQPVALKQDGSYTSGSIGLLADPSFGNATDVVYNNARLWTL